MKSGIRSMGQYTTIELDLLQEPPDKQSGPFNQFHVFRYSSISTSASISLPRKALILFVPEIAPS